MKKLLLITLIFVFLFIPTSLIAAPSVFPTGTTIYYPDKCWNGYVVLAKVRDGAKTSPLSRTSIAGENWGTSLIDMNGNVVHFWKGYGSFPGKILPGGYLMAGDFYPTNPGVNMDTLLQLDWDGNIVWQWNKGQEIEITDESGNKQTVWTATQHHDYQREPNPVGYYAPGLDPFVDMGKTLIFGRDPVDGGALIWEVNWNGDIIWEWWGSDWKDKYPSVMTGGRNNIGGNCTSWLGPNKWYNAGDERFHPDNIIMDNYNNVIFIISHETGEIVWQVGPDYTEYPQLDKFGLNLGNKYSGYMGGFIGGMLHHSHMIPKGLPGEGNILVFNNGEPYSLVTEFNPVTLEKVWEYSGPAMGWAEAHHLSHMFSSPAISSAQRLPNGNTMIVEGDDGRIFEVTPELETVWEYISPVYDWPGLANVTDPAKLKLSNMVYRAYRVPYDWVPQLERPIERAVIPPDNKTFRIESSTALEALKFKVDDFMSH